MSDNVWDDEEFSDKPDGAQTDPNGKPAQVMAPTLPAYISRPQAPAPQPAPQVFQPEEEEYEEEAEEQVEEEDFSDVLSDAHLRLEQGSLYKLIMNHELFQGVEADPKAIQNVQKEIRKFARERMEVMLGMRPEISNPIVERLEIDFPFNAKEVEALKDIAYKLTKGESANSDRFVPEVTKITEEAPVVPRRQSLNPIGTRPAAQKKAAAKPLPAKPPAPVKRTKVDRNREQLIDELATQLAGEGVSKDTIKAGLYKELSEQGMLMQKPLHEMTAQELAERDRVIAQRRGRQVKNPQALPPPTEQQLEQHAVEHANKIVGNNPFMRQLMDTVKNMPIKTE